MVTTITYLTGKKVVAYFVALVIPLLVRASTCLTHHTLPRNDVLKLDDSCTSDPEIRNLGLDPSCGCPGLVRSAISDFGI
jgi:hypothetical protein